LVERNKFLMMNALTVKINHQHILDIWPALPHFLWSWSGQPFPLRGHVFGFWVITLNPGFVSCYDPLEEFCFHFWLHQFLADKHMFDFKFSRWRVWCSELSSGLYCHVKWLSTDVSEVRTASIIRDNHPWRQLWTSNTCCCSFLLSEHPFEFAGMFRMRGLSCQESPKWYFVSLSWWLRRLSSHFRLCNLWRDDLNACSLQAHFAYIWIKKPTQMSVLPMTSPKAVLSILCMSDKVFSSL
jgi:hypothetical protein